MPLKSVVKTLAQQTEKKDCCSDKLFYLIKETTFSDFNFNGYPGCWKKKKIRAVFLNHYKPYEFYELCFKSILKRFFRKNI